MMLLTKEIKNRMPPLCATEHEAPETKRSVCKFFDPTGAGTWYVFEASAMMPDGREVPLREVPDLSTPEDILLFCYVTGLGGNELGITSFRELESFKGRFGLGIERDRHYTPETLATIQAREG